MKRFFFAAVCAALMVSALGCARLPSANPDPAITVPHAVPDLLARLLPSSLMVLGELHDVPGHQQLQYHTVEFLLRQQHLHAVVLEMAERGHHTVGLAADASVEQVQQALQWSDSSWPWARYGPQILLAVRAGVPVYGGNLPRNDMRAAMGNTALDAHILPQHLQALQALMQEAHCGLLPESQLLPMARIQIGRDLSMAQTLLDVQANQAQGVTVLITGNQHARKDYGVPWHLQRLGMAPQQVKVVHMQTPTVAQHLFDADALWTSPPAPEIDHCAQWRQRMPTKGGGAN